MAQGGLRPFRWLVLLPILLTRHAKMCDHSSAAPGHFRTWNNVVRGLRARVLSSLCAWVGRSGSGDTLWPGSNDADMENVASHAWKLHAKPSENL